MLNNNEKIIESSVTCTTTGTTWWPPKSLGCLAFYRYNSKKSKHTYHIIGIFCKNGVYSGIKFTCAYWHRAMLLNRLFYILSEFVVAIIYCCIIWKRWNIRYKTTGHNIWLCCNKVCLKLTFYCCIYAHFFFFLLKLMLMFVCMFLVHISEIFTRYYHRNSQRTDLRKAGNYMKISVYYP